MSKEVYRHYGHNHFDQNLFIPIHNREFSNKPIGGLWSCPTVDVDRGWYDWSIGEEFHLENLKEHFDFTIKDSARILEIKNMKDLDKLPRVSHNNSIYEYDTMNSDIDFEELTKDYDGIKVWMYRAEDLDRSKRLFDGIYYRLYGWDVDTLLVFNPSIIEEII